MGGAGEELDPQLNAEIQGEAMLAFLERLIDGFLAKGYSLERPDELEAAVVQRLKDGPGPRGSGIAGCNRVAILALLPSPQRLTA